MLYLTMLSQLRGLYSIVFGMIMYDELEEPSKEAVEIVASTIPSLAWGDVPNTWQNTVHV
jgi:hypothetical protein